MTHQREEKEEMKDEIQEVAVRLGSELAMQTQTEHANSTRKDRLAPCCDEPMYEKSCTVLRNVAFKWRPQLKK